MKFMEDSLNLPLREILPVLQQRIVSETRWFGVTTQKNPLDFWIYQELIYRLQPDVIVEIGNDCGGSMLALAHLCDLIGKGRVIGVDVSHARVSDVVRRHPRITLIEGDACSSFDKVAALIRPQEQTLVIEDSSHTFENTLNVLRKYSPLVKRDGYFIVEDGICHHGLDVGPNPGPYEAITSFVAENPSFVVDRSMEAFLITWNPRGFLRRV
jgi:cephalosporin hydroxylase